MKYIILVILCVILTSIDSFASDVIINRVIIDSPIGFEKDRLNQLLKFKSGDHVTEAELNIELKRLYQTGFFKNVEFELEKIDKFGSDLVIKVSPKLIFGSIDFKGNNSFTLLDLQKISKISPGDEWTKEAITKAIEQIRLGYQDLGYYKAKISYEPRQSTDPLKVNIVIHIWEGAPTTIDLIEINGVPDEYLKVVKKSLNFERGAPYKSESLQDSIKKLRLKLYRDHYLESEISEPIIRFSDDETRVLVKINIKMGAKYTFSFNGNEHLSNKTLLKLTTLVDEDFLRSLSVEDIMSGLIREYHLQGFQFVTVSYDIKENHTLNEKEVSYFIDEGPRVFVRNFKFPLAKHLSPSFYENYFNEHGTPLLKSGYLNIPDLEIAMDQAIDYLNSRGFLNAELEDYKLKYSEDKSNVDIEIFINEGEQTRIDSVNFSGNKRFPAEKLYQESKLKIGIPLTYYQLKQAERALLRFYKEEGFYYAEIKASQELPQIHFKNENKLADIYFSINEGNQIFFGDIIFRGQVQTKEEVIRREIEFLSGDVLTPSAIRKSEANISRTGIFQSVVIRPINTDPNVTVKRMLVLVKERNPGMFELGAGVASEDGPRGYIGFVYRNFMGWNRTIATRVNVNRPFQDYRFLERNINIGFEEPYLFDTPLIYRLNLIYLKEQSFPFDEERLEAMTIFEKVFADWFKMFFYYSFQSRDILPVNTSGPIKKNSLLGMLGPTFTFEFRDDIYNPTKGAYNSIWTDLALPAFGSQEDIGFFRIQEQTNLYIPIFNYFTLATALNAGYLVSTNGQAVPLDKTFYLGGRKTIRGFPEWTLGTVKEGTIVLESYYINPRIELRFPLYYGFAGALFYDGGNVFFPNGPARTFRSSAGPSFRFISPVGPLSVDVGIILDPKPTDPDNVYVHFAVGTF